MQNKWIRRFLPLMVLVVSAAIAYALIASRSELPKREAQNNVPVVRILVAEPGPLPITIHSRGTVASSTAIELVSEVSGRVIWVAPEFVVGGAIKQGAALLRIDSIDYEVALSSARAALASAELSLQEAQVLVMKAAIDEAKAQVLAARDRLRQAEMDLANTEITAPFDAIIDSKGADLGQYVQAGTALMKLLGTSSVEIRLPVPASEVPLLRYGQSPDGSWPMAELTARFGAVEYRWQARLVRLEQRVDEQTRVFYLVAEVESPYDANLHPWPLSVGLFVEASIEGHALPAATRLPRSALHPGDFVYILEQGLMARRPVTVLRREQESVIVGVGLSAGDQVILSRLDIMVEDMPATTEP